LDGLAYALLLHWHPPPQQSTAVEISVMVLSFLPVVIWPQVQTTPVYTVVKIEQQPVRQESESAPNGFFKHQLVSRIRGIN
jgi:hypothetical protein